MTASWISSSRVTGPAVTVEQRGIDGRSWDAFRVIVPDLSEGKGFRESGEPWAERVIAFDPAKGVYREISAKPLP